MWFELARSRYTGGALDRELASAVEPDGATLILEFGDAFDFVGPASRLLITLYRARIAALRERGAAQKLTELSAPFDQVTRATGLRACSQS